MPMIPNKFPKFCKSCGVKVGEREGFAILDQSSGKWETFCRSSACIPEEEVARKARRVLTAEGRAFFPYDPAAVQIIKKVPGALFLRFPEAHWQLPLAEEHRRAVLDIAEVLKLEVAPELYDFDEPVDPDAVPDEVVHAALERAAAVGAYPYQLEGVKFLSERKRCLLGDAMGTGKGLGLNAKIMTPSGWKTMRDMWLGSKVLNPEGGVATVVGVYPQGVRPVYRFTFNDGTTCEADINHIWRVTTPSRKERGGGWCLRTTAELLRAGVKHASGDMWWEFPLLTRLDLPEQCLPIDPYALGALLGRGHFSKTVTLHTPDTAVVFRASAGLGKLGCVSRVTTCDGVSTGAVYSGTKALRDELSLLGLREPRSFNKFIPPDYLMGSTQQRLDLLHGLMDTGGNRNSSRGSALIEFSTVSPQLADDVAALVRSLGGTAQRKQRTLRYSYKGERGEGRTSYRLFIKMPPGCPPFWLRRKLESVQDLGKYQLAKILDDIEYVRDEKTVCILLDSENHLFVTDDYVVTHNTMQSLLSIPEGYGAIAVVPSTVKLNWAKECRRWRPDLRPHVLSGVQPSYMWPEEGEVLILNPDILPEEPEVVEGVARVPVMIIGDEAHLYKNKRTKRHKSMRAWGEAADRLVLMTGTPMTNRPPDLWGVLTCLGKAEEVFDSYKAFCRMFGNPTGGKDWQMPELDVPLRLRRVMLRRTKDEVLKDLPPWTDRTLTVDVPDDAELTDELAAIYDEFRDDLEAELESREMPPFHRLAKVRAMLAAAKSAALMELLDDYEANDTPVVVFSVHKPPVRLAAQRPGWALITGETKNEDRQTLVDQFQAGKLKGLALTIGAGSVGITLTRASDMIFVDLDWTPALNHQARDRINRIGQKAESLTYTTLVIDHPVDERVSELLAWKTELFRRSVDASADVVKLAQQRAESKPPSIVEGVEYDPNALDLGIVEETPEERDARLERERKPVDHRFFVDKALEQAKEYQRELLASHHRARAERNLDAWLDRLRQREDGFTAACMQDRGALRDAFSAMLGACDGARKDDGVGFNKPDSLVARSLAYLDIEDNDDACEAVARLLYKYRRQVSRVAPHLYDDL